MEVCHNPLKLNCQGTDIVVYIQVGSEKLPICRECWRELADSDVEWGEEGFNAIEEKRVPVQTDQAVGMPEVNDKKAMTEESLQNSNEPFHELDAGAKFAEELIKGLKIKTPEAQ
ncbi:MAG: hypothetical protein ACQCN4_02465 [Candidatus Bathyarchaeia archaeon]|jgi:hypothetical protein